jgi:hypothetical protein
LEPGANAFPLRYAFGQLGKVCLVNHSLDLQGYKPVRDPELVKGSRVGPKISETPSGRVLTAVSRTVNPKDK